MLKELLLNLTGGEVKYSFTNPPWFDTAKLPELLDLMLWFTETEFSQSFCDDPESEAFAGFMSAMCLLAVMALRQNRVGELKLIVGNITAGFAKHEIGNEHPSDCIYNVVGNLDSDGLDLLREEILKRPVLFVTRFWDVLQVIHSYEHCLEKGLPVDYPEADMTEEVDDWPELIG